MRKLLTILFLGIFLVSLVSSLDEGLIQVCGGDDELYISCLPADSELTHLGGEIPGEGAGVGGGGGAVSTTLVKPPEEIPEEEIPISFFSMVGLDKIKYGAEFFFIFIFLVVVCFFIYLDRKKKKEIKKLRKEIKGELPTNELMGFSKSSKNN